jgi:hypothetical protein
MGPLLALLALLLRRAYGYRPPSPQLAGLPSASRGRANPLQPLVLAGTQ